MTVWAYVRVSTDRQADEGQSLGAQHRQVLGYVMMKDLGEPVLIEERGVSGSIPLQDRPAGSALLAKVKRGDAIVSTKLDSMFRSAVDALNVLETLKDMGVSLHLIDLGGDVSGNGISKLVFTILSAVAESERDRIRERISDVKRDQRARGRYLGGKVPFGFRIGDDGELVEDGDQQAAIRLIKDRRAEGAVLREIRAELATAGTRISMDALHRIAKAA